MLQFHNIGNVEDVVYFGGGGFLYLLYWQLPVMSGALGTINVWKQIVSKLLTN